MLSKYTTLAGSLHLNVSLSSSSSSSSLFWLDKVRSALIVVLLWLIFLYLLVKVGSNWEKKVRLNEKQANADLDELTVRSVSFFYSKKRGKIWKKEKIELRKENKTLILLLFGALCRFRRQSWTRTEWTWPWKYFYAFSANYKFHF